MLGATNRKATVTAAMSHTSSTVSPPCQLLPYVSQMRQLFFSRCLAAKIQAIWHPTQDKTNGKVG